MSHTYGKPLIEPFLGPDSSSKNKTNRKPNPLLTKNAIYQEPVADSEQDLPVPPFYHQGAAESPRESH